MTTTTTIINHSSFIGFIIHLLTNSKTKSVGKCLLLNRKYLLLKESHVILKGNCPTHKRNFLMCKGNRPSLKGNFLLLKGSFPAHKRNFPIQKGNCPLLKKSFPIRKGNKNIHLGQTNFLLI